MFRRSAVVDARVHVRRMRRWRELGPPPNTKRVQGLTAVVVSSCPTSLFPPTCLLFSARVGPLCCPQAPLDRYVFNHGDLQVLKLETKWDQTWGFDFNQYAKIFRYAREQGIRLVGLNAPQSLLKLINRVRGGKK